MTKSTSSNLKHGWVLNYKKKYHQNLKFGFTTALAASLHHSVHLLILHSQTLHLCTVLAPVLKESGGSTIEKFCRQITHWLVSVDWPGLRTKVVTTNLLCLHWLLSLLFLLSKYLRLECCHPRGARFSHHHILFCFPCIVLLLLQNMAPCG